MAYSGRKLSDILFTQLFSDKEGKKVISQYLKTILYVTIILLPGLAIYKILYLSALYPLDYILFVLTLFFIFLLYLVNKGRVRTATFMLILSTWISLTFMAFYSDGIKDIAVVAYIVVIFLAMLLVGYRYALVISAMSIVSVWAMVFIPPANGFMSSGDNPLMMSIDYTVLFIVVITSIILFARSYQYSYDRLRRELNDREKAEEKLSESEISLKEKNEELYISNLQMKKINKELQNAKEKAEESDRLKTAFIQNISHEIRTPMNGIVGFIDLLKHTGSDNEKKEEYIGIINSCTQQLVSLVNDLIDISKIETGAIELNISEFQPGQLKNDLENTFSGQAAEKGLELLISDEIGTRTIKSDHGKIKIVINHLVSNAIKFTLNGSISVRLSHFENKISISVKDTGIGISESDKAVIFDRFRQAENELNRSYGGSGLGLSISKGIVDFLGGNIWFESQSGIGSEFTFSIPVEFSEEKETPRQNPPVRFLSQKLKILATEDDEISYLYLKELLTTSKCEIVWAKNGLEAVEIIRNNSDFDLVLMDLKMPVMNGYEATEKIKSLNSDIPVIAVSSFANHEEMEGRIGKLFSGFIVKPIEKYDLLRVINKVTNT